MVQYNKIFFYYLISLILVLAVFIFFLFKKSVEFGCLKLENCLTMKASVVHYVKVENNEAPPKLPQVDDKTKVANEKKQNKKVAIYPESGTLILYDQSTEFTFTLFNNLSETIKIRFYLAENEVHNFEILPNEKKVIPFKIHPYETKVSWEFLIGNQRDEGFVEVLKMDQKYLLEAINKNRKVMILE